MDETADTAEINWQPYEFFLNMWGDPNFRAAMLSEMERRKIANKKVLGLVKAGTLGPEYQWEYKWVAESTIATLRKSDSLSKWMSVTAAAATGDAAKTPRLEDAPVSAELREVEQVD